MPGIGIIIVTYNSAAVIGSCLDAALASAAEVLVVDNASADGTVAEAARRGARLIANPSNLGFAAAVNQGFAELNCPYILLLNPDAVLNSGLEPLREACDLPRAAGACGQLVDASGRPQVGFMVRKFPTPAALILESILLNRIWPSNPINAGYRCLDLDYSALQPVEQPAGAFLMIRRVLWEELGGFDEQFWPLWFEDVDFCRRAADRGYLLYFVPQAVAKHTGAHSIPALTLEMRRFYWYCSLLRYAAKHFRPAGVRAVCLAVVTGSCLRAVLDAALKRSLRPITAYGKVIRLAGRVFVWPRSSSLG
jgi:N-acetylglucosaminyl-diphospho-decaprenol L-rhamnosyltransferase